MEVKGDLSSKSRVASFKRRVLTVLWPVATPRASFAGLDIGPQKVLIVMHITSLSLKVGLLVQINQSLLSTLARA